MRIENRPLSRISERITENRMTKAHNVSKERLAPVTEDTNGEDAEAGGGQCGLLTEEEEEKNRKMIPNSNPERVVERSSTTPAVKSPSRQLPTAVSTKGGPAFTQKQSICPASSVVISFLASNWEIPFAPAG